MNSYRISLPTFDTPGATSLVTPGGTVFVYGWHEPAYDCSRFRVETYDDTLTANADWPAAFAILASLGVRDPATHLRAALVIP